MVENGERGNGPAADAVTGVAITCSARTCQRLAAKLRPLVLRPSGRRPYRCLAWAGVQARVIATVALLPIQFVVVWPNRQAVFGDSVAFYVLSTQLALVTEVARGALEGLAVAIGLNAIGEPIQAGQAPVDTRGDAPGAPEPEQ